MPFCVCLDSCPYFFLMKWIDVRFCDYFKWAFSFLISEEVKSKYPKITYADLYQVIIVWNEFIFLFIEIQLVHFGTKWIDRHFIWHGY